MEDNGVRTGIRPCLHDDYDDDVKVMRTSSWGPREEKTEALNDKNI